MPADSGNSQDDREYDRDRDIDRGERPDRAGSKQKVSAAAKGTGKDLSHVPCKFFKVGGCTAGSSCPFSHSNVEPGGQKETCTWFIKGNCKFGHKCALAHVLPGQSMAMDRKNKKAAQHAAAAGAGGHGGPGGAGAGDKGGRSGGGRVKRDTSASNGATRLPLLAGGATAPTRDVNANSGSGSSSSGGRPPMNMALKATISPSAPAPPLKDTDFFAPLEDQMEGLPSIASKTETASLSETASAQKSADEASPPPNSNAGEQPAGADAATGSGAAPVPLPLSAPRSSTISASTAAAADFGPIGSPPNYRSSQPISPIGTNLNGGTFSPGTSPRRPTHLNGINNSSSPSTNSLSNNNNINNGINNTNASLLSSSPFSAPGTQSVFIPSSYSANADPYAYSSTGGIAASLGSGLAMMGGGSRSRRWADMDDMSMESGSPAGGAHSFSGLLSSQMQMSSSVGGQRGLNGFGSSRAGAGNSGYDISIEYDEFGGVPSASRSRREDGVVVEDEDLEDFLPSSLNDLLTPEERSRRMSRSNSGQGPAGGGGGAGVSYLTNALANATSIAENGGGGGGGGNYNGNGNNGASGLSMGMGHRYSRSVPAPTLLGDIKSIWADSSALPSSPPANINRGTGTPSASYSASRFDSYLSQSQAQSSQSQSHYLHDDGGFNTGGGLSMSMGSAGTASSLGMMSPSNASAAFLPGLQQNYLNAKAAKQQAQAQAQAQLGLGGLGRQIRGTSNPLFSNSNSNASANNNNNNSLASNYMQQPLGGLGLPSSASNSAGFQHTHTHGGTQTTYRTTPSPFDLTQGLHQQQQQQSSSSSSSLYPQQLQQQQQQLHQQQQQQQQYSRPIPATALHSNSFHLQDSSSGLAKDTLGGAHLLSPSARALQQHAPGQSLPQGLAAGYSRIHALPPLKNVVGSPPSGLSGGVGALSGFGGFGAGDGYADWSGAGAGAGSSQANVPAGTSATGSASGAGGAGLETMFSRLSYSAATRGASSPGSGSNTSPAPAGSGSGPSAPPGLSRNISGGRYASQQVPTGALSPLSGPVVTRDDDDLFDMDK